MTRYDLHEELGRGASGTVHRARDTVLNRDVAIKFLVDHFGDDDEPQRRFRREMELLASLSHPNVVRIYDSGQSEGRSFFVMELHSGSSLEKLLSQGLPDADRTRSLFTQLLEALDYIHTRGVLHRDIKPSNVLMAADGRPVLSDFGIARRPQDTLLTAQGAAIGSLAYMAPEVIDGDPASIASDIWSMGVLIFESLSGKLPFEGESTTELIHNILNVTAPPVNLLRVDVPVPVSQWVARFLTKEPAERWPDARSALAALATLEPTPEPPPPLPTPPAKISTRTRALSVQTRRLAEPRAPRRFPVVLTAGIALVVGFAGLMSLRRHPVEIRPSPSASPVVDASGLCSQALAFRSFLPALNGSNRRLRASAIDQLRRISTIDMGKRARDWSFWIETVIWLQDRKGPRPGATAANAVPMVLPDEVHFVIDRLEPDYPAVTPSVVKTAFQFLMGNPEDGRAWLLVGRLMQLEGKRYPTRHAYEEALARLGPHRGENYLSRFVTDGLVEALHWCHRGIEKSWLDVIPLQMRDQEAAWLSLSAYCRVKHDIVTMERLTRAATELPLLAEAAWNIRTLHFLLEGQAEAGAQALASGLARFPRSVLLHRTLVEQAAHQGDVDTLEQNYQYLHEVEVNRWRYVLNYMRAAPGSCDPTPVIPGPPGTDRYHLEAFRQLECGRLDAVAYLTRVPVLGVSPEATRWLRLGLEQIAAGRSDQTLIKGIRAWLLGSPNIRDWDAAVGIMGTKDGILWMEDTFRQIGNHLAAINCPRQVIAALWCSRRGLDEKAVELLAYIPEKELKRLEPPLLAEIIIRATVKPGEKGKPLALARLIEALPAGRHRDVCRACVAGQIEKVRKDINQLADSYTDHAGWSYADAAAAVCLGDKSAAQARLARVRARVRYDCNGLWRIREVERLILIN
jgi:serine/threonine protein kinase